MTVHYFDVLGPGLSVAMGERFLVKGERFLVKREIALKIAGVRDWSTPSKSASFISPNRPRRHSRTQISTQGAKETQKNESSIGKCHMRMLVALVVPAIYSSCHIKTPLTINYRLNAIQSM